jgi:divalent metal cation (Fe/Co/Zn/Cd) transporter
MRQAAGKQFADVVIGVSPEAAVGQGHAAADAVENAFHRALPESDVVVHVEPAADDTAVRERVHAAAALVPRVRELHNVATVWTDNGLEISLHLKLPGELSLVEAHEVASEVERAIQEAVPEVASVQTHLEPLTEETAARSAGDVESERDVILRIVGEATGARPRQLRFLRTDDGLVAYLTLGLDPDRPLAEAHARASEIEERIRSEQPGIADVIVHTEP